MININEELLTTIDENGLVTIKPEEIEKLIAMKEAKEEESKSFSSQVNEIVLNLMKKYNIKTIKSTNYTISQVIPSDNIEFNEEKFLLETPDEILADVITVVEDNKFNEEKFKEQYPELYSQFVDTNYITNVNVKKLAKNNPTLYNKYTTVTKSEKPITIRIKGNK